MFGYQGIEMGDTVCKVCLLWRRFKLRREEVGGGGVLYVHSGTKFEENPIRSMSYVVGADADQRRIETQLIFVIDGRCVADGQSLTHVGPYTGFTTNGN